MTVTSLFTSAPAQRNAGSAKFSVTLPLNFPHVWVGIRTVMAAAAATDPANSLYLRLWYIDPVGSIERLVGGEIRWRGGPLDPSDMAARPDITFKVVDTINGQLRDLRGKTIRGELDNGNRFRVGVEIVGITY